MPRILGLPKGEEELVQRTAREVFNAYCPENYGNQVSTEDLCQYGVIGLLEARSSFDESKGTPWLAFARFRVRGAMLDSIRKHPLIRLPQAVQKKVQELKQICQMLQAEGVHISPTRLASQLNWSVQEACDVAALTPGIVQLNMTGESDDKGEYHGEVVSGNEAEPEKENLKKELAEQINLCLQHLTPQNRIILSGLNLYDLKLRELAFVFDCTAENIRVRNKKSGEQVKNCLEKSGWPVDSFYGNELSNR